MENQNKDELLQKITEILTHYDLNSKQRKDLINYYNQIKNDIPFLNELKKFDKCLWLQTLEEAYLICESPFYVSRVDRNPVREVEKVMRVLMEKKKEEAYELYLSRKIRAESTAIGKRMGKSGVAIKESVKIWYLFDRESHSQGVSPIVKLLMKEHFDIDVCEGFKIDFVLHKRGIKSYVEAILTEMLLLESKEKIMQYEKERIEDLRWIHHQTEWFDGRGYPDGLTGEEIPFNSRLFALAEAFDIFMQMYKDLSKTLEVIDKFSGTKFDPEIIKVLKTTCQEGKPLYDLFSETTK